MSYETLRVDAGGGVATIALDRPDVRNALSPELLGDLHAALVEAREDAAVRVVVLRSTHPTVFSSGASLAGFADELPLVRKHEEIALLPEVFELLGKLGKPSICAADGHVLAGALGLALACDLILAKEGVTFGTPEVNVGAFPFMVTAMLEREVGRKRMAELMLLGDRIGPRPRGRPRLPALATGPRLLHRRPRRGRPGLLRETRAALAGPLTWVPPVEASWG